MIESALTQTPNDLVTVTTKPARNNTSEEETPRVKEAMIEGISSEAMDVDEEAIRVHLDMVE